MAVEHPRPSMSTLEGCTVQQITVRQANVIIKKYEWKGTIGRPIACYGLITPIGEHAGVVVFGHGPHSSRNTLFDGKYIDKIVCLERGACVHWAHEHAASFLISRAIKAASKMHGWEVFYAYSDPDAGEIGTVYQACNWIYLGQGRRSKDGKEQSERYKIRPRCEENSAKYLQTRVLRRDGVFRKRWEQAWDDGLIDVSLEKEHGAPFTRDYKNATFAMAKALWGRDCLVKVPASHVYVYLTKHTRKFWLEELRNNKWEPKPYPKRPTLNGPASQEDVPMNPEH